MWCGAALGPCLPGTAAGANASAAARKKPDSAADEGASSKRSAANGGGGDGSGNRGGGGGASTVDDGGESAQIGWATEAKDWAGELISGQTTTGRILVGGGNVDLQIDRIY